MEIKKIGVLLILFLLSSILYYASAQNKGSQVKGIVLDSNNNGLDYYQIKILNQKDSTVVLNGSFVTPDFEFNDIKPGAYLLSIYSMGFEEVISSFTLLNENSAIEIPAIKLRMSSVSLNEVVVTGKVPLVRQDKNKISINIENSILSDAGTISDMLSRTPGLITDAGGGVAVIGKGSPIIFLNDKQIMNTDELSLLSSNEISKVEILRNPPARYSASGRSVIIIKTKRAKKNTTMLQLTDYATFARKTSNNIGIQLNQNINRYSGLFSYSYGVYNQKQYTNQYQTITQEDYIMTNLSDLTQTYKNKSHNIFIGTDYKLTSNQYIGLQVSGRFVDDKKNESRDQRIHKTNNPIDELRNIQILGDKDNSFYSIDLDYRLNPDSTSNSLSIIGSYAYKKLENKSDINELEKATDGLTHSLINSNNKYHVYSFSTDYQFNLLNYLNPEVGVKFAQIKNDGNSRHFNITSSTLNSLDNNLTKEYLYAGYLNLQKEYGKLSLEAGLRYEYSKSTITTSDLDNDIKVSSSELFPSLGLTYTFSKNLELSLNYSRSISRQDFSQINPNRIYLDSLSYIIGNPDLRPSFSNDYELGISFLNGFNFTFGVEDIKNPVIFTGINDETNQDITKFTYINLDKARYYTFGLSYSLTKGIYSGAASYSLICPDMKIPFLNEEKKLKKAMSIISLNNSFSVTNKISLFCDFRYRGPGEYGIADWKEQYNLSAGIRGRFLKQSLNISLLASDIFHKNSSGNYDEKFGNITNGMRVNQDTRFVRLTVRYTFNSINSRVKRNTKINDELNRIN